MHASPISASIVAACCTALAATVAFAEALVGGKPQSAEDRYVGDPPVAVESWVEGLEAPWSLVFLPDGQALVSERPGRIRLIEDGRLRDEPYAELDSVGTGSDGLVDFVVRLVVGGEGGLMGLALHPDFPNRPYVYALYTHDGDGGPENRVIRLEHRGGSGRPDKVILQGIPASRNHNGGRIGFGPDDLFVSTMRSEALLRLGLDRTDGSWKVTEVEHWFVPEEGADGRFGRLRDAVVGPDGALYVLTSNRDGRGSPRDDDDRILRLTRR